MRDLFINYSLWQKFSIVAVFLVLINVFSQYFNGYIDLTEDKRFSLTPATRAMIKSIDEPVYIKILLDGKFPSGFKRLQASTLEILNQFQSLNGNIQFELDDPIVGDINQIKNRKDELSKAGIHPTSLKYYDGTELVQKVIYPFAILNIGNRKSKVNLLEEQGVGMDEDIVLNNSISLLEYKFADAFQKLLKDEAQNIVFTTGNGELSKAQTFRLEKHLRQYYNTGHIHPDSVTSFSQELDLIIVAGPRQPMSLKTQFKLDQYIMNGGKVLWLIEKLDASLDSIAKYKYYVPREISTGLEDILFKYGIRIQPNLIMDMECTQIPQIVGMAGDKPQTMLFPWYYHPVVASKTNHPIVKNIDRVNLDFPSTIDTIKTSQFTQKTVLLTSSKNSRLQYIPMRLNFEILKEEPDARKFNDGNKPIAVLVEGKFESAFKNRVSNDMKNALTQLKQEFKEESNITKMIVVSDVDFAKNLVNYKTNETEEIGYNKWENRFYKGNKDFIYNSIEYLLDEKNILTSRSKEVKLRMLDVVQTKNNKIKWQAINLLLPLLLLGLSGLAYNYWRKQKYTKI